ncbi:MAG: hypothetical protein ACOCWQ_02945 [Nanoarchaeota archaeon]
MLLLPHARRNKRGIFFVIDVILAVSVLVVGLVLVFSSFIETPTYVQSQALSSTVMNYFASTRINQVNVPYINQLVIQGNITDPRDNIVTVLGSYYHRGDNSTMHTIISNVTTHGDLIIRPFSLAMLINDTVIYNTTGIDTITDDNIVVPSKRIIMGLDENGTIWGPYTAEVWVW